MTTSTTIRTGLRLRALLCVVLAASLGVPLLSAGTSAEARPDSVQILAVVNSSPALVGNRLGHRGGDARQQAASDSPFLLVTVYRHPAGRGQSATAAEYPHHYASHSAGTQSGRSPPLGIS